MYQDDKKKLLPATMPENAISQYIVTNCDLVRVRYMLVYAKQPASMRFPTAGSIHRNGIGCCMVVVVVYYLIKLLIN